MKRFFKWVGIILGGLTGAIVLLIAGIVVYDKLTREDPNRNVEIVKIEPAPGGGKYELVVGRKREGDRIVGWRIYRRNKGDGRLPAFALASWEGDIQPALAWWSATDANICIPLKQGIIRFQVAENMVTTSDAGGQFEGDFADFAFKVNHTCPAS